MLDHTNHFARVQVTLDAILLPDLQKGGHAGEFHFIKISNMFL
jgi:hypothetical protein